MKADHKCMIQRSQNMPQLQNTERIFQVKRPIEQKQTPKKTQDKQQHFHKILNQTKLFPIYNNILTFQLQIEQLLNEMNIQKIKNRCYEFKNKLIEQCQQLNKQQKIQNNNKLQQSQKTKQLLSQIQYLKNKISQLDNSLVLNFIAQDNQQSIISDKKSINSSYILNTNQPQIDIESFNQLIVNFMELKNFTYQLLSLIWKLSTLHLTNQSYLLLQGLKNAQKFQFQIANSTYNPKYASLSLDRIQSLVFLAHNCTVKLKQRSQNNNGNKVREGVLCI